MGRSAPPKPDFTPFRELDLMISQGYGDVPQWQLPKDWRTVRREDQKNWNVHYRIGMPEELLPRKRNAGPGKHA